MAGICDTCHAGCCRALTVIITAYDASVISRALGLPIAEFATFAAVAAENADKTGGIYRPIVFSDPGQDDRRFFLVLKRVPSTLLPGSEKCYFLQEWRRAETVTARGLHPGAGIVGRCGIYESRPFVCRIYPTRLHENQVIGFIETPAPTGDEQLNEAYRLCPEPWTPESFQPDPAEALHTLALSRHEIEFQNQAVGEWNRQPGRAHDFLPYMLRALANRFRRLPETPTPTG